MAQDHRKIAKVLAKHYFKLAITGSGGAWDIDNSAEIDQMIDAIIDASVQAIKQTSEAERNERLAEACPP